MMTSKFELEKGAALAVEWIGPECNEFIIGFQKGAINIFKAETKSQKPSRILNFDEGLLNSMEISFFHRPINNFTLIVKFTRDKNGNEIQE